jgi:hypothetical protein
MDEEHEYTERRQRLGWVLMSGMANANATDCMQSMIQGCDDPVIVQGAIIYNARSYQVVGQSTRREGQPIVRDSVLLETHQY